MKPQAILCVLLSFTLLAVGCKGKGQERNTAALSGLDKVNDPDTVNRIKAVEIPVDIVLEPSRMAIINDHLIISCFRCQPMVYIYSLPEFEFEFVDSFGVKGQGPDDFLFPVFCNGSFNYLYIWGYADLRKIKKYDLKDNGELILQDEIKLDSVQILNQIHLLKDSFVVYNTFPEGLSIKQFDLSDNSKIKEFEFERKRNSAESFFEDNRGSLAASDQGIAYLYSYKGRIDFFDPDLNLQATIDNREESKPTNMGPESYKDNVVYFDICYAGKNSLYALYRGFSLNDKRNLSGCCIKEYDWNGKEMAVYYLDSPLNHFVVKEDEKIVYGYNSGNPDVFLRYELN